MTRVIIIGEIYNADAQIGGGPMPGGPNWGGPIDPGWGGGWGGGNHPGNRPPGSYPGGHPGNRPPGSWGGEHPGNWVPGQAAANIPATARLALGKGKPAPTTASPKRCRKADSAHRAAG